MIIEELRDQVTKCQELMEQIESLDRMYKSFSEDLDSQNKQHANWIAGMVNRLIIILMREAQSLVDTASQSLAYLEEKGISML